MNERAESLQGFPTIAGLPNHLRERVRLHKNGTPNGKFVLYWMRSALRTDENPALDVARILAAKLDLPLLVYHGLSENYEFASDRHHTFILQAAQDLSVRFREIGIAYGFHLETKSDRRKHLLALTNDAAVAITEEMPVDPPRRFLTSLAAKSDSPILCVDTACVVPMQLVPGSFERAFEYRDATKELYAERQAREWPSVDVAVRHFEVESLPFEPVDLAHASIADLVAKCEIDHAVGPVVDTTGGSSAGYTRWQTFRDQGLKDYAKQRNDALMDGVSRMSPYLHYGMVSPMRMAREAANLGGPGAEKFLDELLIWRELAYTFCFHRPDHHQWTALPTWAQETLEAHAGDPREDQYSWEKLARGQTTSTLWNAAQISLLMHGELHNNVRMTWGKAILDWTASPQAALKTIIDLNHRYALDGRDPSSYGGILWCLGQFDRPFKPARPIIGTVRPRPVEQHAERLSPDAYYSKVSRPRHSPVPRIAVIGAGLSGLFAARTLSDHGLPVTVFEKSRGVGGRMATRRNASGHSFDHGAQYFTVRDQHFARYVESWCEQGIVSRWPISESERGQRIVVLKEGRIESESSLLPRYVGVPTMNAVCKHLAAEMRVVKQTRIQTVEQRRDGLCLIDEDRQSLGSFERVIVSAPAEQTSQLLANFPSISEPAAAIEMNPCWATMVAFPEPLEADWAGAFVHDSFLSWVARNQTKPGRNREREQLVIHATPAWTVDHWENDPETVALLMQDEFFRVSGYGSQEPLQAQAHRWKYAIPVEPVDDRCLFDDRAGIVACGDWLAGSRVEGAFLSGMAAAGRILGTLRRNEPKKTPQHDH